MEMNELVSVVMPCFNAEEHISEAIRSVAEQSYTNIELIVVDDGSTDDTLAFATELAEQYSPKIKLLQKSNGGPYPARNLALRHAGGGYIAFLDADDYWAPECISKLHSALRAHNADLAYCGWQNVGDGGPGSQPHTPPKYEDEGVIERFLNGCPWPIHAALVKKEIVDAVGGFSERYFTSMDYDFWLRIVAHTQNIVLVPEVMAFYRWHDAGQISSNKWRQVNDAWQVRHDFIKDNPELIRNIEPDKLRALVDGTLLRAAYTAYWKRDLASAQQLFRKALSVGFWAKRDLKYILPSLLPGPIYRRLIGSFDSDAGGKHS